VLQQDYASDNRAFTVGTANLEPFHTHLTSCRFLRRIDVVL
jgi:hypothetical protein